MNSQETETYPEHDYEGSWYLLKKDNTWGVRISDAALEPGEEVIVKVTKKKDNTTRNVRVKVIASYPDDNACVGVDLDAEQDSRTQTDRPNENPKPANVASTPLELRKEAVKLLKEMRRKLVAAGDYPEYDSGNPGADLDIAIVELGQLLNRKIEEMENLDTEQPSDAALRSNAGRRDLV